MPPLSQPGERPLIVVVEDNDADVILIHEALQEKDLVCDLRVFQNGELILNFLDEVDRDPQHRLPRLFLLDLKLPRVYGEEIFHRLQAGRCARVPFIAMSSSDAPEDQFRARAHGAWAYFHKPMALEQFMAIGEMVRQLLEQ